jgi:DNA-binding MarR family transcriptional regulator
MSRSQKRDLFLDTVLAFRECTSAADALNHLVAERMGTNRTDHRVLEILGRHGPMAAGDIADAAHLTTGAVTTVLDRLEHLGYARRTRDADDRRRVLVEQTPECTATAMGYYGPLMERSFAVMERYSPAQLDAIRDFLRDVTALTTDYAAELQEAG